MEFSLPAKVFQAAQIFQAKADVRYYLNGVFVSKDAVVATNGHCMFYWEGEIDIDDSVIISVIDKIPAKTESIEFQINEEDKTRSVGWCLSSIGEVLSVVLVSIVDGNYPDWKRLVKESSQPTETVGINATYLDKLQKAIKLVGNHKYCGAKMVLSGENEVVRFDINGPEFNSTVLIMPMRL